MYRFSGMLLGAAALTALTGLLTPQECRADESINSFLASEPAPRTAAYLKQGQRNVRSVAAQLKTLLEPLPADAKKIVTPLPQPDFTIIPGNNGRSTLIYRCR